MQDINDNAEEFPASPSRRRAMKAGAAAAVGVAVWAEPTIKGLTRRPAYAQGASGGEMVTVSVALTPSSGSFTPPAPGDFVVVDRNDGNNAGNNSVTFTCIDGGTISVTGTVGGAPYSDTSATGTVTAGGLANGNTQVDVTITCS